MTGKGTAKEQDRAIRDGAIHMASRQNLKPLKGLWVRKTSMPHCLYASLLIGRYICPYWELTPSNEAKACMAGGIGLICIACLLVTFLEVVWVSSYDAPFNFLITGQGPVKVNSVLSTKFFALSDYTL